MNFIPKIEYTELDTGTPKTLTFDNPPEGDPFNERQRVHARKKRSTDGTPATQFNYSTEERKIDFIFQSEVTYNAFKDFYLNHAGKGGKFNYFVHSDEVDFDEFELDVRSVQFKKPIPSGVVGEFEHDFSFKMVRVL